MDKMLSVQSKKANKQPNKTKKKPVKVVHISNPMKFNTSASEFRALVQELTGQDSEIPDDYPSRFTQTVGGEGTSLMNECDKNGSTKCKKSFYYSESPPEQEFHGRGDKVVIANVQPNCNSTETVMTDNSDLSFEDYAAGGGAGEDFVPELLENFPGMMSSNMWYD